jgi:hypothetical protein
MTGAKSDQLLPIPWVPQGKSAASGIPPELAARWDHIRDAVKLRCSKPDRYHLRQREYISASLKNY